eukprot:scaffold41477_cov21-Tisochrysis_lutea.AAC.1
MLTGTSYTPPIKAKAPLMSLVGAVGEPTNCKGTHARCRKTASYTGARLLQLTENMCELWRVKDVGRRL